VRRVDLVPGVPTCPLPISSSAPWPLAVTHPVLHVLVAVDIPLARAQGALDVDRERRQVADVVRDPPRNHRAGTLPERGRLWMLRERKRGVVGKGVGG